MNAKTQKNYEELWNQIRDLIRSISNCLHNCKLNNPEHFDGKYMKMKFNSDDDLPLKTLKFHNRIIVVDLLIKPTNHANGLFVILCTFL